MGLCPSSALLPHNLWGPVFSGLFKTRLIAFRLSYGPRYQPKMGDQRSLAHFTSYKIDYGGILAGLRNPRKLLKTMVEVTGFEPVTPCLKISYKALY